VPFISYDSQGYGGGVLARLHEGLISSLEFRSIVPIEQRTKCVSLINSCRLTLFKKVLLDYEKDRLFGLLVRVPGYRYRGPGSIPGATRFSGK
jgi:hypothetical protein